jgi:enolase
MSLRRYPLCSIEDPFDQDDFASYAQMTEKMGKPIQVVGDDLLVTNPIRVQKAIDLKACNSLLLKASPLISAPAAGPGSDDRSWCCAVLPAHAALPPLRR